MVRSLTLVVLLWSLAPALATAPVASPSPAPRSPREQVEAALLELFRAKSSTVSDYGVILATRYKRITDDRAITEARKEQQLLELLAQCRRHLQRPDRRAGLVKVSDAEMPPFVDRGDRRLLRTAIAWALAALAKHPGGTAPFGDRKVRRRDLIAALEAFRALVDSGLSPEDLQHAVQRTFDVYRSPGLLQTGWVLFTAYNDPVFEGSLRPTEVYRHPIYREPRTRGMSNRSFSRSQIASGSLAGRGLEIAWLKDPLDAYLLEVEGAGLVHLTDGQYLRVQFAAKNGRHYQSLAKAIVRAGYLKPWEMDISTIRRFFAANPDKLRPFLDLNPSFVFFKHELVPEIPAVLEYVPQRSVACDQRYFPRAGLGFVWLKRPVFEADGITVSRWESHQRFVVNHDTGGAIKGPGHIDLYWGHDREAQRISDSLREPGALYYLVLKGTKLPHR